MIRLMINASVEEASFECESWAAVQKHAGWAIMMAEDVYCLLLLLESWDTQQHGPKQCLQFSHCDILPMSGGSFVQSTITFHRSAHQPAPL